MNTFDFIGTINKPKDRNNLIKHINGKRQLGFYINQNENNNAYVQLFDENLINNKISVVMNNKRTLVPFEERFDKKLLSKISNISKYKIYNGSEELEFIYKGDFIDYFLDMIEVLPENTIYEILGEFLIGKYENKIYYNFNIKTIRVNNSLRPELKLNLDLFYNYNSLDESDKRNKFILNAFVEQYVYTNKRKEYFPIQTIFVTNRFDFKKPTDIEIIKHRKSNLSPSKEEGYVCAKWECQYVKGAQLFLPTLETLPKDIQFEIKNAGRDLQEYMGVIVGEAKEYICLNRPDNTLNKDGKIYYSLKCTDNEFENKINQKFIQDYKSLDSIAKTEAIANPFN